MKRSDNPAVSVVMTVYNRERHVGRAIQSVLEQSWDDFELIIVDDGSTDGTVGVVSRMAEKDRRIIMVSHTPNRGISYSANRGISASRGRYIARIDSDDIRTSESLRKQAEFLDRHPDTGVVGGAIRYFDESGRTGQILDQPVAPVALRWKLSFSCAVHHTVSMVRRSVFERLGGYDESLAVTVDYDLFARAAEITRLANLPDVIGYLRRHEGRASVTRRSLQAENALTVSQRYVSNLLEEDVPISVIQLLTARKHVQVDEVEALLDLLNRIGARALARCPDSARGRLEMRREAARLMIRLFWRFRTAAPGWSALWNAHCLDPSVLPFSARRSVGRLAGRLTSQSLRVHA